MKINSVWSGKLQLAFGSAIVALLIVGVVSYRGMAASGESHRWVRHTHEVLENLLDLQSAVQSSESSDRMFVLTGNQSYIEAYGASSMEAVGIEGVIRELTADNPSQQRRLDVLDLACGPAKAGRTRPNPMS